MSIGAPQLTRPPAGPWNQLPVAAQEILLDVLIHGPLPRAEIAARLRLSRPTLSRITQTLVREGLLREGEVELRSATGRPSELLYVRGDAGRFLGIMLSGDHLYATATDLNWAVLASVDTQLRSREVGQVVDQVAETCRSLTDQLGVFTAVGATLSGRVQPRSGASLVLEAEWLGWHNVPFAELVTEATGLPTVVDNDVQALAGAEHWFGDGVGLDLMAMITIGAGIGCSYIVGGELVNGAHATPGKLEHLLVNPAGPVCVLGHRGCATSYLTNDSIVHALGIEHDGLAGYPEAVRRARHGDPAARRVFADAGFALGSLIGTVASFLDPQRILLTGDGIALYDVASREIAAGIAETYQFDPELIDLQVQPFDFGRWVRSAAALAIRAITSHNSYRARPRTTA